jgi:hypothetical protein
MRNRDHLARLDERKPKTMFLHRKVTEEVSESASHMVDRSPTPMPTPLVPKMRLSRSVRYHQLYVYVVYTPLIDFE